MASDPNKTSASVWKQRYENRRLKQQKLFEDAKKYYDILYAVQNTSKISPWKSKVYVPVLASKAWDLIARLSDIVPFFNVQAQGETEMDDNGNFEIPDAVTKMEERVERKLHNDYTRAGEEPMKLRVFDPLVDAVAAGTGYAYAPWCFEEKKTYKRTADSVGNIDNSSVVVTKKKVGYNGFEGINFFNVFVADAPSFYKAPYLIVRGIKPYVEMDASGMYTNLDKVKGDGKTIDDVENFNQSRNRVVNESGSFSADESVETVVYFECYERTKDGIQLTTYAEGQTESGKDSWVEIRAPSYPYWHNMFPIVPFYCRKKTYSVFGESLFENNRTMQSATNDLFNHYLDNWNLSVDSMLMYEDGSLTNDFVIEPGGEVTYTGEKPTQFKFPEPNPQQLSVVMNVLEKGIDAATFSPYASGTPSDGNDKTQGTAYGVKSITEAATTKIGFFRDNFKQSMSVLGRIWLSNLKQFADDPEEIRYYDQGQEKSDIIVPTDYQADFIVEVDDDSMTPISKTEKRDLNTQFSNEILNYQKAALQQYAIWKDPTDIPRFNFHELVEESADMYSRKGFQRFLLDSKAEIPQDPPKDNTKELLNFSYKDAPPDVQAQIEEMYGLQPSAIHDSNLTHDAIKQGAEQGRILNEGQGIQLNGANGSGNPGQNQQAGAAA